MSNRLSQTHRLAVAWVAALVTIAVVADASKGDLTCRPPTPGPCGADGICRPNCVWGYSQTRWRPWPGDPQPEQPTPADEQEADEEMRLPGLERPSAEREDVRGPTKAKPPQADDESDAEQSPQAPPEEDALPGINLQGGLQAVPSLDDNPPALPRSLRKVSLVRSDPNARLAVSRGQRSNVSTSIRSRHVSHQHQADRQSFPTRQQQLRSLKPIKQTVSQRRVPNRPVNRAVTGVASDDQQAIFYKARGRKAAGQID